MTTKMTKDVEWPGKLLGVNTNELERIRSEDEEGRHLINKCPTIVAHSISAIAARWTIETYGGGGSRA